MNAGKLHLAVLVASLALVAQANAQVVLVYDNGPINGGNYGRAVNYGWEVSDSFAVTSPTTLVSAQAGLYVNPGATPTSLDWSIGTSAYGSDISSGTASLANTYFGIGFNSWLIYESDFAVNGTLADGTYFLTLQNTVASDAGYVWWNYNNGPSVAFQSTTGQVGSESFQIYGTNPVPAPEPTATAGLAGLAAFGMFGQVALRRKVLKLG